MTIITKISNALGYLIDTQKYGCKNTITKWHFDDEINTLTISGKGDMDKYMPHFIHPPWYMHKKLIKKVIIKGGLTSIGSSAFIDCENLEEVIIPDSVGIIGMWTFNGCISLTKVKCNAWWIGDKSFLNCTNLESIEMNSVIRIGKSSFKNCNNLKEINFMNLVEIEDYAFENCKKLSYFNIRLPDKIAQNAFNGCTLREKDITMMLKEREKIKSKKEKVHSKCFAKFLPFMTKFLPFVHKMKKL